MAIEVVCRECGQTYHVNDKFAAQRAKCRDCGAAIDVPGASTVPKAVLEPQPPNPARAADTIQMGVEEQDTALSIGRGANASREIGGRPEGQEAGASVDEPTFLEPTRDGTIIVDCHHCGKPYRVATALVGVQARCRACGHMIYPPGTPVPGVASLLE